MAQYPAHAHWCTRVQNKAGRVEAAVSKATRKLDTKLSAEKARILGKAAELKAEINKNLDAKLQLLPWRDPAAAKPDIKKVQDWHATRMQQALHLHKAQVSG
jgi:hypothetical protein